MSREELLSFAIPGFEGSETALGLQQMYSVVNDRLARGGRVKTLNQTSVRGGDRASFSGGTFITVVIEYSSERPEA